MKRKTQQTGRPVSGVVVMTKTGLEARADRLARDLLNVTRQRAFKMLDDGKLRGTLAEASLRPLRHLIK